MNASHDQTGEEIRALLKEWQQGLLAKDADRMTRHYSEHVVFYDATPPLQHHGIEAYRRSWEMIFPHLPDKLDFEDYDSDITVSGDLAVVHFLNRLIDANTKDSATCGWVRVTVCFKRMDDGQWKVVHEHVSIPFDPMSGKAVFTHQI